MKNVLQNLLLMLFVVCGCARAAPVENGRTLEQDLVSIDVVLRNERELSLSVAQTSAIRELLQKHHAELDAKRQAVVRTETALQQEISRPHSSRQITEAKLEDLIAAESALKKARFLLRYDALQILTNEQRERLRHL